MYVLCRFRPLTRNLFPCLLQFLHSPQFVLCVLKSEMGICVHRDPDFAMTHKVLQCLWVHSRFSHIAAIGVAARAALCLAFAGGKSRCTDSPYSLIGVPGALRPAAFHFCRSTEIPRTHLLYEVGSAMSLFAIKYYASEYLSAVDNDFKLGKR